MEIECITWNRISEEDCLSYKEKKILQSNISSFQKR